MKILLCNIPVRPKADSFPPVACTSLCDILIKEGYNPFFYDIDSKRPCFEDLSNFFREEQFDIVGISAVVSTGYRYVKDLADIIKKVSPKTQIILGGNLAAAWQIVLRKCRIDVCVIGEGEKSLLNLVRHWEKYGSFSPCNQELREIKGIAFLDGEGSYQFTGHEKLIAGDEIAQPNYELLDKFSSLSPYMLDPVTRKDFASSQRSYEPHRRGGKMAIILTSKGCINRCTFCHRWIEGYRIIPVEKVITTVKHLKEKYNVSFFCIGAECFGENKQWLEEFIRLIKPLDVLFQIGGARVSMVKNDPTVLSRLKEAGLVAVYFGMESGSDKVLKIMEKNATRDENLTAIKLCKEEGIYTVIQLVIGMPGENSQTISETIEFVKKATGDYPYFIPISINYLQSLPGTPTYEFLRRHGFLGKTIEDEEKYLLNISDIDANEFRQYINVSEEPLSEAKLWQVKIDLSARIHWLKQRKWKASMSQLNINVGEYRKGGNITLASRIKLFIKSKIIIYRFIDFMGEFFWKIILLRNRCSLYGLKKALLITAGFRKEEDRSLFKIQAEPLRKILRSEGFNS
jgi:radical SAM superfamily enzyme YgiQ (UPF0313 family)